MRVEVKTLAQINHEAIIILYRHLGVADTLRFMRQFTNGHGNYTEERREWFADLTLDEIVADIEKNREQPEAA
jgi:hypothetical protein